MDQRSILLMPDSFKGTMSSREICAIMVQEIAKWYPDVPVRAIPVADGGEGTVDCFLTACGGERIRCHVQGPLGEEIEACYGMIQEVINVPTDGGSHSLPSPYKKPPVQAVVLIQ